MYRQIDRGGRGWGVVREGGKREGERERESLSLGLNGLLKKDIGPCQLWWRERDRPLTHSFLEVLSHTERQNENSERELREREKTRREFLDSDVSSTA